MENNECLIDFIVKTDWSQLPDNVRHQSKRCFLDTLGAMIAGHKTPVAELMASFAAVQFRGNESSILVKGNKLSASGAALVNGFANNALDIDDGYRLTKGHPGACVLPVARAEERRDGKGCGVLWISRCGPKNANKKENKEGKEETKTKRK